MALFVCSKCRTLDYSELILQDVKFVSVKRPVSFMPGKNKNQPINIFYLGGCYTYRFLFLVLLTIGLKISTLQPGNPDH